MNFLKIKRCNEVLEKNKLSFASVVSERTTHINRLRPKESEGSAENAIQKIIKSFKTSQSAGRPRRGRVALVLKNGALIIDKYRNF